MDPCIYSVKRDRDSWILTVNGVPLVSYASESAATAAALQFATSMADQGEHATVQIFGSGGDRPSFEAVLEARSNAA